MLELRGVYKTYEGQPLLRGISFAVDESETICLLGASGSGKSTLLRMIAGLELPDAGQILWDGHDLAYTPPHLRDFGLVFQDYALFPHLTVSENAAFGLKMRNWPKNKIQERVTEVLNIVNLNSFGNRKVTDLSGGEQQRVAFARALAPRPRLLMFDEPLGALDRALREYLLNQLRGILHRTGIPAIYVTHDQQEAISIADRVLLLHDGQIARQGSPKEVWENPGSAWAAEFLGLGNVIEGLKVEGWKVETKFGIFDVRCGHRHRDGEKVHLLVRPLQAGEGGVIRGRAEDVVFQSDRFKVTLDNGLYFYLDDEPKVGEKIEVKVKLECLG
ncbi:MAG: ABC transporter ATP-binding protein [Chloroflexi bacterium]|nr:ABC transporter ATP-binding protein [Chloroflexota bacterium]MBI3339048.1 ABC transporter ATP-binding protein [Chloroflexota bacterium]